MSVVCQAVPLERSSSSESDGRLLELGGQLGVIGTAVLPGLRPRPLRDVGIISRGAVGLEVGNRESRDLAQARAGHRGDLDVQTESRSIS